MTNEPAPERIDAALLAYHREVLTALREKQAIARSWLVFLGRQYGLGPQDRIEDDGSITRAPRAAEEG